MDFSQTVVSFKKLWFRVWTRSKKQNEDIFENNKRWHSHYFYSVNSKKLVWKILNQKWWKFSKYFQIVSTKNPKKVSYDFLNSIEKICGHLRRKWKWPFWRVFFVDLKQIMKKIFEQKIRHFFHNVRNFFQKFLIICRIRKV
jgi:hypothetical protein